MSKQSVKSSLLGIPIVGYGLRVISNVINAPVYHDDTRKALDGITDRTTEIHRNLELLASSVNDLSAKLENIIRKQDTFQRQIDLLEKNPPIDTKSTSPNDGSGLFAEDHLLDVFYTHFEDRFKNSEETLRLLDIYTDDFKQAKVDFRKHPVVDIGCGRGEFLQFMSKHKINARGVDINTDMVERANAEGLEVEQGDALDYLLNVKTQTLGAVTGFHIVEHIPFPALLKIFSAAHSSLVEDGFVLFETPNPENILVASHSFYLDPSHLRPLPPELLAFALEVTGFRNVEIRRSYPVKETNKEKLNPEVFKRFYGPRNYAVIGYK